MRTSRRRLMRRSAVLPSVATLVMLLAIAGCRGADRPAPAERTATGAADRAAAFPATFDPARDPEADLRAAVAEATRSGRRIILDVGGEWCSWCHILDRYIADHQELKDAIARDYVWLKINFSPENENEAFLGRYPAIAGYPHLFVLESNGTLLHSQDTALLEEGPSYDLERMRAFLATWATGGRGARGPLPPLVNAPG